MLQSPHLHPNETHPVYAKVAIALLLILNNSVMFGAIQAAEMPDEHHPWGQAYQHDYLHHHSHDHERQGTSLTTLIADHTDALQVEHDEHHEHHEHGAHSHMNMDLPQTVGLEFRRTASQALTLYELHHQSQTYTPPVPPPNR